MYILFLYCVYFKVKRKRTSKLFQISEKKEQGIQLEEDVVEEKSVPICFSKKENTSKVLEKPFNSQVFTIWKKMQKLQG